MRSPALWLASRELAARSARVALAGALIAAIAAAVTATELGARAREGAVAARIDAIGPPLRVVPRGVTAGALARYELGDGALPAGVEDAVRAALGGDLRTLERRLVVHLDLAGAGRVPVVGVPREVLAPSSPGSVALGSELARRLGDPSQVVVGGREHAVRSVMPSTGGMEDLAVVLPLEAAQALAGVHGVNELRLFLRPGAAPRDLEARLSATALGAAVIQTDRGVVADAEAQETLSRHRGIAYAVMAVVAALCLFIAAHLDAAERRVELATLVAIGASRWTVLGALVARSAAVAAAGAALGAVAGGAVAAVLAGAGTMGLSTSWALAATTIAAAAAIGVVAGAPSALATMARDPVRELQEG